MTAPIVDVNEEFSITTFSTRISGKPLKNIKIEHKKGNILQIKNVDNGLFENITNFKGEKLPILKEGVNKGIVVK
jgi:hypothetical protein